MRILRFSSAKELLEHLDRELLSLKSSIEDLKSRIETLRRKAEVTRRVEDLLKEVTSKSFTEVSDVRLANVRILLNPQPREELEELEKVLEVTIMRFNNIEGLRNALRPLSILGEEPMLIELIDRDEGPQAIIIRI